MIHCQKHSDKAAIMGGEFSLLGAPMPGNVGEAVGYVVWCQDS
jgi:hypothetical protein